MDLPQVEPRSAFGVAVVAVGMMFSAAPTPSATAQGLNREGLTGAFITPFAYTSASPVGGMGRAQASFHHPDGGSVIGGIAQSSSGIWLHPLIEPDRQHTSGAI